MSADNKEFIRGLMFIHVLATGLLQSEKLNDNWDRGWDAACSAVLDAIEAELDDLANQETSL